MQGSSFTDGWSDLKHISLIESWIITHIINYYWSHCALLSGDRILNVNAYSVGGENANL